MDWMMPLLTDTDSIGHILLVYSVVIALGMALGRIKVFGISLGVTFVLFVALAVSYAGITVNGTVLNFLRDFGLILFVFFIGLQVGPSFFSSFKSGGLQLNLLTLLAVGLSILLTIALFLVLQGTVTLPQILVFITAPSPIRRDSVQRRKRWICWAIKVRTSPLPMPALIRWVWSASLRRQ